MNPLGPDEQKECERLAPEYDGSTCSGTRRSAWIDGYTAAASKWAEERDQAVRAMNSSHESLKWSKEYDGKLLERIKELEAEVERLKKGRGK